MTVWKGCVPQSHIAQETIRLREAGPSPRSAATGAAPLLSMLTPRT